MNIENHPDNVTFESAVERYKSRFYAAHGGEEGPTNGEGDYYKDYSMYGDIIDPNVLNAWNVEASRRYIQVYVDRLTALFQAEGFDQARLQALGELEPVMCGFFEHVFLLGVMFAEKRAREVEEARE